jgi:hypothetical protein
MSGNIDGRNRARKWPVRCQLRAHAREAAIDHKIEQQVEFVRWWRENVRRAGGDHVPQSRRGVFLASI